MTDKKYILASKSPRRKELMEKLGLTFDIVVSDIEEVVTSEKPAEVVASLAEQKARAVADVCEGDVIVIGSDTVVALEDRILGKPADEAEAIAMLTALSGRKHSVFTGVSIIQGDLADTFVEETRVEFYELTREEIEAYVATGDPMDKAGAYGIQTGAFTFVKGIEGDYNTVVGFPAAAVYQHLKVFPENVRHEKQAPREHLVKDV